MYSSTGHRILSEVGREQAVPAGEDAAVRDGQARGGVQAVRGHQVLHGRLQDTAADEDHERLLPRAHDDPADSAHAPVAAALQPARPEGTGPQLPRDRVGV